MENTAKILICDENDTERARLIENLYKAGVKRCDEAKDGVVAIEMIKNNTYDAVIIDLFRLSQRAIGQL